MQLKIVGLSVVALAASTFAALLHAAAPSQGLSVDIASPAVGSRAPWGSQVPYAVTVSYDGKSTKFGEIPSNQVVLRAVFAANADSAPAAGVLPDGVAEISRSNCSGCHDFAAASAGPSFAAIARRYAGKGGAAATLADHIRNGSHGAWGGGTMPPHPEISAAQATAIAQWIVSQAGSSSVQYAIGRTGTFRMNATGKPGPHAGTVLSAFYTGPLKPGDKRGPASGRNTLAVHGS